MVPSGAFFAQVVGTTGAFLAPASAPAPTQNPINLAGGTCTPARTGAGVYTLTFANPLPTSQYKYSGGCIGGAANANFNFSVAGSVCTVLTSVAAVATDENFWIQIEPINA